MFVNDTPRSNDCELLPTNFIAHLDLLIPWGHTYVTLYQPAIAPLGEAVCDTDLFRRLAAAMGWGDEPAFQPSDEELIRTALRTDHPYMEGITYERLMDDGWAELRLPASRRTPFAAGGFSTQSGRCELFTEPAPEHVPPAA